MGPGKLENAGFPPSPPGSRLTQLIPTEQAGESKKHQLGLE